MIRPSVRSQLICLGIAMVLLVVPAAGHAEVMDKEPTIGAVWLRGAVAAGLPWLLVGRWRWLSILTLVGGLSVTVGMLYENWDLDGQIAIEAGSGYLVQSVLAGVVVVVSHAQALAMWRRSAGPREVR